MIYKSNKPFQNKLQTWFLHLSLLLSIFTFPETLTGEAPIRSNEVRIEALLSSKVLESQKVVSLKRLLPSADLSNLILPFNYFYESAFRWLLLQHHFSEADRRSIICHLPEDRQRTWRFFQRYSSTPEAEPSGKVG